MNSFKANFDYAAYPAAGGLIRRLGALIPSGVARTQIPVEAGLNAALPTGYRLQLVYKDNPPQDVIVAAPSGSCTNAVGATCISVNSFTPSIPYPKPSFGEVGASVNYGALARLGTALTQGVAPPACGSTSPPSTCLALSAGLAAPLKAGQTIEIGTSFGVRQEVTVSANGAANATSIQVFGFVPNASYAAGTTLNVINTVLRATFTPLGALSAQRNGNTTYTTITLTNPLPVALQPGQQLEFWANDTGGTQRVQVVTVASVSGQTITTQPFTTPANTTFGVGTVVHQTVPAAGTGIVRRTANFANGNYIARAPYNETTTGYRNRANWRFWDQRQNGFAGGWVTSMAQSTPMLFSNGSINWNAAMGGTYNPYLGRYLAIGGLGLGDDLYLSTAMAPQGPWSPPALLTGGTGAADPSQRDLFPNIAGGETPPAGSYYYAMFEHPEMRLGGGQTIYVSYVHGSEGGTVRLLQIQLPRPSDVPAP